MRKLLLLWLVLCLCFSFTFAEVNKEESVINFDFYQAWDQNEKLSNWFTREFNNAYKFAYKYWITTIDSIEKVNMNWQLDRIAMAKMLSNYLINILKKQPDTSKNCSFSDITTSLDNQYDNWVTKACQLWIMWVWIEKFRPYDTVTRAEFATAMWRALYNTKDWDDIYYSTHLNSLYNIWVIRDNNPKLKELRWYVMIMLMRSAMDWDDPSYRIYENTEINNNENNTKVKCVDDFGLSYEINPQKSLIIPYKSWYIWYDYWWQEWWWIYLTYKDMDNLCDNIAESDTIFWYGGYIEDEEHPLTNVYTSIWNRSSWRTEEVVKKLNCKLDDKNEYNGISSSCEEELNHYIYNLIVWEEEQEYFTQRMNRFKKDIDNNKYTNYNFRRKQWENCDKRIIQEINELKNSLNWSELESLKLKKEHECAKEYLSN